MSYINLPEGMPGIRGLMAYRPETALSLNLLVETLLQGPSTLAKGERELIATHVSRLNSCEFCSGIHGAIARAHFGEEADVVNEVLKDVTGSSVSQKMKTLLRIATKVQQGGSHVLPSDIENAKTEGATDVEIHDTVLIAAAFCMFNRYVDGLNTDTPENPDIYEQIGSYRAKNGYLAPNNLLKK